MKSIRAVPTPPPALSAAGKALWKRLTHDFPFNDAASRELLERACACADRAAEAQVAIDAYGVVIVNKKTGSIRSNPAVAVQRDARAQMLACFKMLGLHETPHAKKPGRPMGS